MKRLVAFAVLLLLLTGPRLEGAAGKEALTGLLDRVEPRRGFTCRSAVLVPLVLREGIPNFKEGEAPGMDGPPSFVPEKRDLVRLVVEEGASRRFLPAGTLLHGLGRERMLSRPVFLVPHEELIVRAPFCDSRDEDAPEESEGDTKFGPLVPHAQRKAELLLKKQPVLADLQRVQAILAGLGAPAKTVREVMRTLGIAERVKPAEGRFHQALMAYGMSTAGHVLFIGMRPVEVVLFNDPAMYRKHGGAYLSAAAVSLTLWETYYGVDPDLIEKTDDRLFLPVVEKILATLRAARVARARLASGEKGGGEVHKITTASTDSAMKFPGRLLLSTARVPFQLEAYQDGERLTLASPLTKPGGRPTDAKPDVSHGAMTKGYLQRLAARMAARGR